MTCVGPNRIPQRALPILSLPIPIWSRVAQPPPVSLYEESRLSNNPLTPNPALTFTTIPDDDLPSHGSATFRHEHGSHINRVCLPLSYLASYLSRYFNGDIGRSYCIYASLGTGGRSLTSRYNSFYNRRQESRPCATLGHKTCAEYSNCRRAKYRHACLWELTSHG